MCLVEITGVERHVEQPALAARDGRVLIAWYTGADDTPSVRIAMANGGAFGAMQQVEAGPAVLGRVAVALDAAGAAPVAGSRLGEGVERLDVDVTVQGEA